MPIQNCPLCQKEASVNAINYGKQKKIECPRCKVFIIDMGIEKVLTELKPHQIQQFMDDSINCPVGLVYYIHKPDEDNLRGHCIQELIFR